MIVGGLDLGQAGDPTALAINDVLAAPAGQVHQCRYLHRFPLGTSYPDIVDEVHDTWKRFGLGDSILCVDYTGVGRPVVDLFLRRAEIPIRAVCITGGSSMSETEHGYNVPKKDLAAVMQILLRRRRFQVAAGMANADLLMKELQHFRVKITNAGNETFECLVGDTMVATDKGDYPIRDIRVGDNVLTRSGYRRVLWSGITKRVSSLTSLSLSNGKKLVGTGDHLVWTVGRGWVPLECVGSHDDLLTRMESQCQGRQNSPKLSHSTARYTASALSRIITTVAVPHRRQAYIGMCGNSTTDRSRTATRSITRTVTRKTTTSAILNVSPRKNTPGVTSRDEPGRASCVELYLLASPAGVIAALLGVHPEVSRFARACASGADNRFSRSSLRPCTARLSAGKHNGTPIAAHHGHVNSAVSHFRPNTECRSSAQVLVQPATVCRIAGSVPVYDLVVEDCHEFFANDVLVHNSWREGDHDDLVLAAAMPCWLAEKVHLGAWSVAGASSMDTGRCLTADIPDGIFGSEFGESGVTDLWQAGG